MEQRGWSSALALHGPALSFSVIPRTFRSEESLATHSLQQFYRRHLVADMFATRRTDPPSSPYTFLLFQKWNSQANLGAPLAIGSTMVYETTMLLALHQISCFAESEVSR